MQNALQYKKIKITPTRLNVSISLSLLLSSSSRAFFNDTKTFSYLNNINLLLTKCKGRTGAYWPKVVSVWTECSKVCTKTRKSQYSPVWLEQAKLESSLLYGTRFSCKFLNSQLLKTKNTWLMSVWQNPDQERTNHNAQIYLKTALPYEKHEYIQLECSQQSNCHIKQDFTSHKRPHLTMFAHVQCCGCRTSSKPTYTPIQEISFKWTPKVQ